MEANQEGTLLSELQPEEGVFSGEGIWAQLEKSRTNIHLYDPKNFNLAVFFHELKEAQAARSGITQTSNSQ